MGWGYKCVNTGTATYKPSPFVVFPSDVMCSCYLFDFSVLTSQVAPFTVLDPQSGQSVFTQRYSQDYLIKSVVFCPIVHLHFTIL